MSYNPPVRPQEPEPLPPSRSHARIVAAADGSHHLDPVQLSRLEESFRQWANAAARPDVQLSRQRILLIFLLIRYTGAKLNEVLALNPFTDIHYDRHTVVFGKRLAETRGRLMFNTSFPQSPATSSASSAR